jgi:hypothetical protein
MKRPDLSRDRYSDGSSWAMSSALTAVFSPAHSGPELATCVPEPSLAQDLARTLLNDRFELTHYAAPSTTHATSGIPAGFSIGLARR